MNEIIKSLYDRKSVRVYEDRPIPEKMKQIIYTCKCCNILN